MPPGRDSEAAPRGLRKHEEGLENDAPVRVHVLYYALACASLCRGQRRAVRGRDNQEEPEVDSRALVRDCKELYLTLQA